MLLGDTGRPAQQRLTMDVITRGSRPADGHLSDRTRPNDENAIARAVRVRAGSLEPILAKATQTACLDATPSKIGRHWEAGTTYPVE